MWMCLDRSLLVCWFVCCVRSSFVGWRIRVGKVVWLCPPPSPPPPPPPRFVRPVCLMTSQSPVTEMAGSSVAIDIGPHPIGGAELHPIVSADQRHERQALPPTLRA